MNKINTLLARRYLLGSTYEGSISTMVLVCFIGIMISTFSLTLVSAIMRGFEHTVHEKMQGIHADIIMRSPESLDIEKITSVLQAEFPEVIGISPSMTEHAIIHNTNEQSPSVVILRGIDPDKETVVSSLSKKLKDVTLNQAVQGNKVAIGKRLAHDLELVEGMPFSLLYFDSSGNKKRVSIHEHDATVGGIFETGIDEYDSGMVLASLSLVQKIYPDSTITHISLRLNPSADAQETLTSLKQRFPLDVYSWKELYPALVSALQLEKYAMFLILMLIMLVASMNIIALLFMMITQKKSDIAILRAMGTSQKTIVHIFMMIGNSISITASLLGIAGAWLVSWTLESYPLIELPDVYYVSHIPAKMEWSIALAVISVVVAISLCATWFSARQSKRINIANVLRFEG